MTLSAHRPWLICLLLRLLAVFLMPAAWAKIQFDVFPGYDSVARSGAWFPVVIEVYNDGAGFDGVIEVTPSQSGGAVRRVAVELPANTRKRILIVDFATSKGVAMLDARLLDKDGKLRADNLGQRVTQLAWENFVLGAAPQVFAGMPTFPEVKGRAADLQPRAVRISQGQGMETFPDNPIALEGLNAIYLHSGRAVEMKDPQVESLLVWLQGGGHLIVAVDQGSDVNATRWLKDLLPVTVEGSENRAVGVPLTRWLTGSFGIGSGPQYAMQTPGLVGQRAGTVDGNPWDELERQPDFEGAEVPVAGMKRRAGVELVTVGEQPLIVTVARGRGQITVLGFNPERDPFKGWKHRSWFWARLAGVHPDLLVEGEFTAWGGRGMDAVFGAMVETRQVRKLPVGVLLGLLVVYLLVIGPLDQWWLKRINRPMLTWITFPSYVVLFSLLIYYIGFRLRSGNSEWNEFHVVDVLPRGGDAVLRGRSYGSVYSPTTDTYRLASATEIGLFRPEFQGMWGNVGAGGKMVIQPGAKGFEADMDVGVWNSRMGVAEWLESGAAPIQARWDGADIVVANRRASVMTNLVVISDSRAYRMGSLEGGGEGRVRIDGQGESYLGLVQGWTPTFQSVANRRAEMFGSQNEEYIDRWADAAVAATFTRLASGNEEGVRNFIWSPGFDLTPVMKRGDAVILAYLPGESLLPPINQFPVERHSKGTFLRLVLPAKP